MFNDDPSIKAVADTYRLMQEAVAVKPPSQWGATVKIEVDNPDETWENGEEDDEDGSAALRAVVHITGVSDQDKLMASLDDIFTKADQAAYNDYTGGAVVDSINTDIFFNEDETLAALAAKKLEDLKKKPHLADMNLEHEEDCVHIIHFFQ